MPDVTEIEEHEAHVSVASAVRDALKRFKIRPVSFEKDADIQHEGDRPGYVYLVESGWMYSYGVLANGQRQILFLHQPGDMAGFADLGGHHSICAMRCLGDCVVHPIPMSAFTSPQFLTPAIATFFLHKAGEMQSILIRTLMAVGRMGAQERIIWLLLMLHDRLGGSMHGDEVLLPLNQSELGDLIGLTNVSVSKHLTLLSTEGFIERKGQRVVLRRRAELERIIGFEPLGFPPDILLNESMGADRSITAMDHRPTRQAAISRSVSLVRMDEQEGWDGN